MLPGQELRVLKRGLRRLGKTRQADRNRYKDLLHQSHGAPTLGLRPMGQRPHDLERGLEGEACCSRLYEARSRAPQLTPRSR